MQAVLPLPLAALQGAAPAMPRHVALDDPDEWSAFGRALDGPAGAAPRWESQVTIEGMHCAACAFTIEAAVGAVPGVERVDVNAASQRARVVWSAAEVQPSQWFDAALAAGYRLLPAGDVGARAVRAREARLALWRWLVAGFCMMQVMMYAWPTYTAEPGDITPDMLQLLRWASWVLTLPVVFFSCGPFFRGAWRDLRHGTVGMDMPVALGMALAFIVSSAGTFDPTGPLGHEVYFDSLTMFVFFLLTGRWLEQKLRERTAGALEAVMGRLPDSVERRNADGTFTAVAVRRLAADDVVRVLPGQAFPADGAIVEGDTTADEALLTGESRAVSRPCGAGVFAGSYNLTAPVLVRIDRAGGDTRFAQIVSLMESAALRKPRLARLADRVARPFLVGVLLAAGGAAWWWWQRDGDPGHALMVAAAVLIVTCPCALSLATPAAMLASAGQLARGGLLVGDLQALETLARIDTVVFDKTGTLTRGTPRLARVYSRAGVRPGDALEMAAALACQSLHPASRALVDAHDAQGRSTTVWQATAAVEHPGQGVEATLQRTDSMTAPPRRLRLGSATFCGVAPLDGGSVQVHLSDDAGWLASFALVEALRDDAAATVAVLQQAGVHVHLLSGDRAEAAHAMAGEAGIRVSRGDCSPEDKLAAVRHLQDQGRRVAMVGDGLNDGPVIAQAHVSFAFGQAVPLAQARADFIVLGDALSAIPDAIAQARATMRVVRQNLGWAAAYNAVCVPLALVGWMPAWAAGLGMAASSLLVVANAARLSRRTGAAVTAVAGSAVAG
ncbi:MAG: cation-translocating P-type ATPase [Variovorax sp.]|nr:MAG: cation-translocating P-type ATPase [Variovorax sp.]